MVSKTEFQCPECGALEVPPGTICARCVARGGLEGAGWLTDPVKPEAAALLSVPGWRLNGILGSGGMGCVYLGQAENGDQYAAIKILDARWAHDPVMSARFEAEGAAMRQLNHPHIVRVLEMLETDDGHPCLIMEYVEGCDLSRLLRAERLPAARAMEIFQKVCAAATNAHAAGFVHRDIKPSNILIGQEGVVKLADFGLVKSLGGKTTGPLIGGLTATTDQFGTAYYLAPERMMDGNNHQSDPRTDVYSLAVLLYHLLTGRMPLGKYTPLSQLTGLPRAMDGIVSAALEADPDQRTPTVAMLAGETSVVWRKHLAGAGLRRTWQRAAMGSALGLAIAAAAWSGAAWQRSHDTSPPPALPASASQERPWSNSLGMTFVPVPGTGVLFCTHETRRRDYDGYREADRNAMPWRRDRADRLKEKDASIIRFTDDGTLMNDDSYDQPAYPVTPGFPAHGIGIRDAQHFCVWLTIRETALGLLSSGQRYRLPTRAEWLTAAGGSTAQPMPGNIAGQELADYPHRPANWPKLPGRDPFLYPSPVATFPPERFGLYDMSGNLSEWIQDEDEIIGNRASNSKAFLIGPNYIQAVAGAGKMSYQSEAKLTRRQPHAGFRVVLDWQNPGHGSQD